MKENKIFLIFILVFYVISNVFVLINNREELKKLKEENQAYIKALEIQVEANKITEKENKRLKEELEREKKKNPYSMNFYQITNLTEKEIQKALKNTWLSDSYQVLYDIEQEKKINFRAIYAIGSIESGHGKKLSGNFNYFGVINCKGGYRDFNSKEHSLNYLADLLNHQRYKNKSIDNIAPIYCPPNAIKWAKDVKYLMQEI